MNVQYETIRCLRCDEVAKVHPTDSPFEFEVECRCESLISWFHGAPPPEFQESGQGGLPF